MFANHTGSRVKRELWPTQQAEILLRKLGARRGPGERKPIIHKKKPLHNRGLGSSPGRFAAKVGVDGGLCGVVVAGTVESGSTHALWLGRAGCDVGLCPPPLIFEGAVEAAAYFAVWLLFFACFAKIVRLKSSPKCSSCRAPTFFWFGLYLVGRGLGAGRVGC